MKLAHATWPEVEAYLENSRGIILPTGSTEQHGPMGLIGTDALCAELIAQGAAEQADALVAPVISYTPAPFNTAFPGTISISEPVYKSMVNEIIDGLAEQGFEAIYILNGHGANLAPLQELASRRRRIRVRVKSWWDFSDVNQLRQTFYGDWEGMHATPSEIAITQAVYRTVEPGEAADPPQQLTAEFIKAHAGDRHGPPDEHRAAFPDGRVGSHSALATPDHGRALLSAAITAAAEDYLDFLA